MSGAAVRIARAIGRLHRAGRSVGDVAVRGEDGGSAWLVTGSNGENLIRAEAATAEGAWMAALDQVRACGMLDGPRPGRAQDAIG